MKVIVKHPSQQARTEEINGSLKSMQDLVGGYIQAVPLDWLMCIEKSDLWGKTMRGKEFCVVMNEEGKLEGLDYNLPLRGGDIIVGTCFICKESDEEFVGLNDDEAGIILGLLEG